MLGMGLGQIIHMAPGGVLLDTGAVLVDDDVFVFAADLLVHIQYAFRHPCDACDHLEDTTRR